VARTFLGVDPEPGLPAENAHVRHSDFHVLGRRRAKKPKQMRKTVPVLTALVVILLTIVQKESLEGKEHLLRAQVRGERKGEVRRGDAYL